MHPFLSKLSRAVVLAALTSLACSAALAQWQWVDEAGHKVFSDRPPPAGTPDKNVLKRPGPARVAPAQDSATPPEQAPAPSSTAAASPKPSGRDETLEAKKKQAEQAEQVKKAAEAAKLAQARAENCARAQNAKTTLDSGMRIAITNAKGEREVMDDKARASEAQRIAQIIRSDCGPLPGPSPKPAAQ